MRYAVICFAAALLFGRVGLAEDVGWHELVSAPVPHTKDLKVVCWNTAGGSQIIVFHVATVQPTAPVYQSPIEDGYRPKIQFIEEIRPGGIPLILVTRNWGASIARIEVFGMRRGRMARLAYIEGYQFDIVHVAGQNLPAIVVHEIVATKMAASEDIRTVHHWNGKSFVAEAAAK